MSALLLNGKNVTDTPCKKERILYPAMISNTALKRKEKNYTLIDYLARYYIYHGKYTKAVEVDSMNDIAYIAPTHPSS